MARLSGARAAEAGSNREQAPRQGSGDLTGLARRGVLSLGGAGLSAVLNLLLIVVVTRVAGKVTAGYLFSATSLVVVLEGLCALGTVTGVIYFIAGSRALGRHQLVGPVIRTALVPVLVLSVTVSLVLLVLAPTVGAHLGGSGSSEPALYLRLAALFLPFAVVFDVLVAVSQGFHTMTPTVALEKVGRPLLQLVLLGAALAMGLTDLLPVAWMAPYVVVLTVAALWVRALVRTAPQSSASSQDSAVPDGSDPGEHALTGLSAQGLDRRAFWSYTLPRGLAAAAQISLQRVDIVLVALYLGAAPAAVYTAATRFVVLGQVGSQAVALAVQPKLSELMARRDVATTRLVYRTSTAWVVAVTWPIHLLVMLLSPLLLRVFGSGYEDGRRVMVILALAMLVATGCGMVTTLLLMSGRSRENLLNVVVALVTNLSLNVVLIPRVGIFGAGIAWAAAIVLSNLLPLWQVRHAFGLDPFGRATLAVAALALGAFVPLGLLAWLLSGQTVVVLGALAVSCCLYALGVFWLRHLLELGDLVQSVRRRVAAR